jgi:peptide chain release factor subunit 1
MTVHTHVLAAEKTTEPELITLYIPSKRQLPDVIAQLYREYKTATNIKADTTRTHILNALNMIIERLQFINKYFKKLPNNGLVIFCGNIDGQTGIYTEYPEKPVQISLYRCDNHFYTEPLMELMIE